ncbi:uncharacterized protein [Centruroides vittatus]|uniref:uncharacterized protein n=1 Tax=Centruroides vittatus TaxID=120091 RepID=UPI00350F65AE
MTSTKEISCPTCIMRPILTSAKIFGINIISDCDCNPEFSVSRFKKFLYKLYLIVIGLNYWFSAISTTLGIFVDGIMCQSWIDMILEEPIIMRFIFAMSQLFFAVLYSMISKSKLCFCYKRSYYAEESKNKKKIEKYFIELLIIQCEILIISKIIFEFLTYKSIKSNSVSEFEMAFCTTHLYFIFFLDVVTLSLFIFQFFVAGLIICERFEHLSADLTQIGSETTSLKSKLNHLIEKHTELLFCIEDINYIFEYVIPLVYGFGIYISCFILCTLLFVKMEIFQKIEFAIVSTAGFTITVGCSYLSSRLTAALYGNFNSVAKISSSGLALNEKLKLLNFMKRFGKTPIGPSVGGFFRVKKNFVIRTLSSLETLLSALRALAIKTNYKSCFRKEIIRYVIETVTPISSVYLYNENLNSTSVKNLLRSNISNNILNNFEFDKVDIL